MLSLVTYGKLELRTTALTDTGHCSSVLVEVVDLSVTSLPDEIVAWHSPHP